MEGKINYRLKRYFIDELLRIVHTDDVMVAHYCTRRSVGPGALRRHIASDINLVAGRDRGVRRTRRAPGAACSRSNVAELTLVSTGADNPVGGNKGMKDEQEESSPAAAPLS